MFDSDMHVFGTLLDLDFLIAAIEPQNGHDFAWIPCWRAES